MKTQMFLKVGMMLIIGIMLAACSGCSTGYRVRAQSGPHGETYGVEFGNNQYRGGQQYGARQPCAATQSAVESGQGLIDWATQGGQGVERRQATVHASDAPGRANYNCNASNTGTSVSYDGQALPPPGIRRRSSSNGEQQSQEQYPQYRPPQY